MAPQGTEYLLVAFPNRSAGNGGPAETWREIDRSVKSVADVYHFDFPALRVGTLEKLISGSDALSKLDTSVELVLRKIERSYAEVREAGEELTVDGQPVTAYAQNFRWLSTKYNAQRPVEELIKLISQSVQKIDEELKEAQSAFQEAKAMVAVLLRKRGGNILGNLAEFASEVPSNKFINTDYIQTVCVIVPKQAEKTFLAEYETYAADTVPYGPAEDREAVLGSPVLPRSAQLVLPEDKDGYLLYLVTLLRDQKPTKKHFEAFARDCQRNRVTCKEWAPPTKPALPTTGADKNQFPSEVELEEETQQDKLEKAESHLDETKVQLKRWAKTHFGEIFVAWTHLKALRVFVESVLVFGLPPDFTAAMLKPHKKDVKKVRTVLAKLHASLSGEDEDDLLEGGGGVMPAAAAGGLTREEYFPYVSFNFKPVSD